MVDPVGASGLASSIITFLDVAYKIGQRTREFSKTAGALPGDVASAKEIMDIIVRSAERINGRLTAHSGVTFGPVTENEVALSKLFVKLGAISDDLLEIIDTLDRAGNAFAKAIVSIRKEKKVEKVRYEMHSFVISIGLLLLENSHSSTDDLFDVAIGIRKDLYEYHKRVEEKMSAGFQALSDEVNGSREKVLYELQKLIGDHQTTTRTSHIDLLLGQQDIAQSLSSIRQHIAVANSGIENTITARMEAPFSEQRSTMRAMTMMQEAGNDCNSAMAAQLMALASQMANLPVVATPSNDLTQATPNSGALTHGKDGAKGIYIKTQFEFSFHTSVLSIHIEHCIKWASSRIFPSLSLSSSAFTISIPTLHITKEHPCRCPHWRQRNKMRLDLIFQHEVGQYHLLPIDFADEKYGGDLARALKLEYSAYRGKFWSKLNLYSLSIRYVHYDNYSEELRCFLRVEERDLSLEKYERSESRLLINRIRLTESSRPSADLNKTFKAYDNNILQALTKAHDTSFPSEGYAIMIKEQPIITSICFWTSCLSFGLSVFHIVVASTASGSVAWYSSLLQKLYISFGAIFILAIVKFDVGDVMYALNAPHRWLSYFPGVSVKWRPVVLEFPWRFLKRGPEDVGRG